MTGVLRRHFLSDGDALDRRRLEELFLEAAARYASVSNRAIGNGQFKREDFTLATWEEMLGNLAVDIQFITPDHGFLIPDSLAEVVHDDGTLEAKVAWGVEVDPQAGGNLIAMWPVLNGVPVWGGLDFNSVDQLNTYVGVVPATPAVDPDNPDSLGGPPTGSDFGTFNFGLGNEATVVVSNGRSSLGIAVFSIGEFKITRCAWTLRKVNR